MHDIYLICLIDEDRFSDICITVRSFCAADRRVSTFIFEELLVAVV